MLRVTSVVRCRSIDDDAWYLVEQVASLELCTKDIWEKVCWEITPLESREVAEAEDGKLRVAQ